jgi:hypothetical protein
MLQPGTRWIMRASRLDHCADDDGAADLVEAFAAWGLTASPSRLSRWEYGNSRGSCRLLRAYESGCALPPFLLFALNDRQLRRTSGAFSDVSSVESTDLLVADDSYEILDRALTDAHVSGSDWYQLASFAASHNYFYLSRRNTRIVARRLIEELARSLGPGYILRFEAFHLLAGQTRVYEALVELLIEMLEDESTGHLGDAVSLIPRADPRAKKEILGRLHNADSPIARQGRSWLSDTVPDPTRQAVAVDRFEVAAVADALFRELPKWATAHIESDMAGPLLREALGSRSRIKRHEASLLLMLADGQDTLSGSLLDAFDREEAPVLRTRLANLHEYMIPASQPKRLESLALVESEPESRRSLWASRGHVLEPIPISEEVSVALADPRSQFAVSYALGISGSVEDELLGQDDLPAQLRGILGWWKQRGPALLS